MFGAGALFEGIDEGGEAVAEVEAGAGEGDFADMGVGVVEEVVDEAEETLGGGLDDGEALAVGVGARGIEEDLGHAEDAVHGGAELVADAGEELAFGAGSGEGVVAGAFEGADGVGVAGDLGLEIGVGLAIGGGAEFDAEFEFVAHAAELGLRRVVVESHVDGEAEFALFDGLGEEAVGRDGLGAGEGGGVGVGGEEDDGEIEFGAEAAGGLDAIEVALELDVHESEAGFELAGLGEGVFAGHGDADHGVAGGFEAAAEIHGDEEFVFDEEKGGRAHGDIIAERAGAMSHGAVTNLPAADFVCEVGRAGQAGEIIHEPFTPCIGG